MSGRTARVSTPSCLHVLWHVAFRDEKNRIRRQLLNVRKPHYLADSNVLVIAAVVVVLLVIVVVARVVVVVVVVVVVAAAVVGVIVVAAAAAGAPVRIQTVPLTLERCYDTESSWNSEHTTVGPLIKKR